MKRPFRHPREMEEKDNKTPVSARIRPSSLVILKKAANDYKIPISRLIGTIIDDYADWLKEQK